jgi:hypothetical protein
MLAPNKNQGGGGNEGILFFIFLAILTTTIVALAGSRKRRRVDSQAEGEPDVEEHNQEQEEQNDQQGKTTCMRLFCGNLYSCFCAKAPSTPIWRSALNKLLIFLITSLASATASLLITHFCSDEEQSIEDTVEKVLRFVLGEEGGEADNDRRKREIKDSAPTFWSTSNTLSHYIDSRINIQALWASAVSLTVFWSCIFLLIVSWKWTLYRRRRALRPASGTYRVDHGQQTQNEPEETTSDTTSTTACSDCFSSMWMTMLTKCNHK